MKQYQKIIFVLGVGAFVMTSVWYIRSRPQKPMPVSDGKTITITEDGLYPESLTVVAGTTVKFVNSDTYWHWPASDPHPSHTFYPVLDPKEPIKPDGSWEVLLETKGSWGIHDHLAPYIVGTIIVQ
jgi:plastocyanin